MTMERSTTTGMLLARLRRRSVLRGLGVALSGFALRPFSAAACGLNPELVEIPVNPEGRLDSAFGLIGTTPGTAARAISGPLAKRLAAMTPSPGATLRIFHYNDMHNHLVVRDSQKGETHPLSQIVKRVRRTRAKAAADEVVLLLTAGDDRTGTEFDKLLGDVTGDGFAVDPSYVAYSAAGVDAGAIGNHEFDHGARTLRAGMRGAARFLLLAANLSGCREIEVGRDYFPAAIGVAGGLRIGFLGLGSGPIKLLPGRSAADSLMGGRTPSMSDLFWLSERQLAKIEPHFPLSHGVPRVDDRRVISGIVHVIRNGLRWRDAPPVHGPHKTLYNRFVRWSRLGVFSQIFAALTEEAGPPDRLMIDATHLKAHRTAASLYKKGLFPDVSDAQKAG